MLGIVLPSTDYSTEPALPVYFDDDWDNRLDVVVLGGRGAGNTARALLTQGVQRVIALLPVGAEDTSLPPEVGIAHSQKELWKRLIELDPPPNTVTVRKIPNGGFHGELHLQLADVIERSVFNRATYVRKSEVWVRNFLRNFAHLTQWPSVGCLAGAFKGKPCVIVSPGPSLAKNIDALRDVQDKVLIIASNRSVGPLCEAGIKPHLAIVADPLDLRYQLPDKYLRQVGGLILDLVGHCKMFNLNAVRKFSYTNIPEIHLASYAQLNLPPVVQNGSNIIAGGSVATTAFRLALELGCHQLILVGQDLALAGNKYYIDTAPDGHLHIEFKNGKGVFHNYSNDLRKAIEDLGEVNPEKPTEHTLLKTKSWDESGEVFTSTHFKLYRHYYESIIPKLPAHFKVFNCTEGGAHIKGAIHRPLREILSEVVDACEQNATTPLDTIDQAAQANTASDLAEQVDKRLRQLETHMQEAIVSTDYCTEVTDNFSDPDGFAKLDAAEATMATCMSRIKLVSTICQPTIEAAQRKAANAQNLEEALAAGKELYGVFGDAARRVLPLVEQAIRKGSKPC